ncbi:MAG TPA: alpha/beta hydrolase-fold protein [Anaerolineae bacterium]
MPTTNWHDYKHYSNGHYHTVVGMLRVARNIESPQLDNRRDILVYLPPSYEMSDRRYPVLYMHDGQNLFDDATSYAGEWHVDETMERLSREEGLEAIVVGIPNMGARRLDEYSPFATLRHGGGLGDLYLAFIVNTLKPLVDGHFRTLPDKSHTGLMGSSMGGLISLYGFFRHPTVFGFAGAMSPSLWFAQAAIFDYVEAAPFHPGKIYLDAGTREFGDSWPEALTMRARSRRYYGRVRRLKRILASKGYRPLRDILHVEGQGANHNEAAWAVRLPAAIRFFLQK